MDTYLKPSRTSSARSIEPAEEPNKPNTELDKALPNEPNPKLKEAFSTHYNDRWQGHLEQLNHQKSAYRNIQKILCSNRKTYPPIYG